MTIAEDATVSLVLSDYANEDAGKKINILGGGWHITGAQPTGVTPPQTLVVFLQVPAKYRGQEFAVCLTLLDEAGDAVTFPAPSGQTKLRIQKLYTVDAPVLQGAALPDTVPTNFQILMRLDNGLPLPTNALYTWEFEIDGNKKAHLRFYVVGPRPPVVLG